MDWNGWSAPLAAKCGDKISNVKVLHLVLLISLNGLLCIPRVAACVNTLDTNQRSFMTTPPYVYFRLSSSCGPCHIEFVRVCTNYLPWNHSANIQASCDQLNLECTTCATRSTREWLCSDQSVLRGWVVGSDPGPLAPELEFLTPQARFTWRLFYLYI